MKCKKYFKFIFCVLLLSQMANSQSSNTTSTIHLEGKALIGFDENHYVIQTEKYFYKIGKNKVDSKLSNFIESAALNTHNVSVEVPVRGIEYVWPISFWKKSNEPQANYNKLLSSLKKSTKDKPGFIQLDGRMMLSMTEPYYLVQKGNTVYQLKKSALTKIQKSTLEKTYVGSETSLSVPREAIKFSWAINNPTVQRNVAAIAPPDSLIGNKTYLSLTGTILYSASEPSIFLQCKNYVYQIKRKGISTQDSKLLDVNGSRVSLVAPIKDIEFYWESKNTEPILN